MKAFKILLLNLVLATFFSFIVSDTNNDPIIAFPDKENSLYLFVNSAPKNIYESLGSVKVGITLTGSYSELKNSLISKAKKKYPEAEGLIFNTENNCESAEVIKFKK